MSGPTDSSTATLLVTCPDRKGLVASLAQLLYGQSVVRASHRDSVEDLTRKGRDVERTVLAAAVRAHLEDRVLVYENKTVVFD